MKLLAISGSLRATSSNAAIVRAAEQLASAAAFQIYEGLAQLPHFSPDLDDDPPATVLALRAAIGACDAIVIATPEYARGMPGSLKNALDWLVSAQEPIDKPVLLISASPSGAANAHAQFSLVLQTMSMRFVDGGAHVFSRAKIGADGAITDAAMLAAIAAGLARLELEIAP